MEITSGSIVKKIKRDKKFIDKINKIIKENNQKSKFVVKDKVKFNDGDLLLALHKVTLNVVGEKQASNTWNLQIELIDKYDFTDYKEINEIIGGDTSILESLGNIANNIAMISTSCNVIREYNINIKFNMDNWEVK